jgi:hypothetical protein
VYEVLSKSQGKMKYAKCRWMSDGKPESGFEYFMENNGRTSKENITKTKYMAVL